MNEKQLLEQFQVGDSDNPVRARVKSAIEGHLKASTGVACEFTMIDSKRWSLFVEGDSYFRAHSLADFVVKNGIGTLVETANYPDEREACFFFL